jgi:hypothetical protein
MQALGEGQAKCIVSFDVSARDRFFVSLRFPFLSLCYEGTAIYPSVERKREF